MPRISSPPDPLSPLEQFVRDYVDAREGAWDEVEPQVYDLLIGPEMLQVAFDPEALPEHPEAQLASLGSPLIDRLLSDASQRWSTGRLYRIGLNVHPHDVESRVRRAIALSADAAMKIGRTRLMQFPQAIFWFKATFASDQKEEEILPLGIDLHYLRELRHLEGLLTNDRLAEAPETPLAEAKHQGLAAGYRAARGHAVRTVASLANARRREWARRVEKQIARMSIYYAQLRKEADDQAARPRGPRSDNAEDVTARSAARREAIDREERLRIAELRQKSAVRVRIKLGSWMVIHQPKLTVDASLTYKDKEVGRVQIVWDPLAETVEAVACPTCGQPTFELRVGRMGVGCPQCSKRA